MTETCDLKLGLIGDNIAQSKAPLLHRIAGAQNGMIVRYDRLVPREVGEDFDTLFENCAGRGYRGLNITYPYKERAAKKAVINDPFVRAMGAVNTVLFEPEGALGMNTDYSGFIAAYRSVRGEEAPGVACLIGAGGVGRALAFGLVALGAEEIRLVDTDAQRAEALANDLIELKDPPLVRTYARAEDAARGATGILNGTPVGMVGLEGTPLPPAAFSGADWAFDAIYTPVNTEFLRGALAASLTVISGYELFIFQGVDAWARFSGRGVDQTRLRTDLETQGETP